MNELKEIISDNFNVFNEISEAKSNLQKYKPRQRKSKLDAVKKELIQFTITKSSIKIIQEYLIKKQKIFIDDSSVFRYIKKNIKPIYSPDEETRLKYLTKLEDNLKMKPIWKERYSKLEKSNL